MQHEEDLVWFQQLPSAIELNHQLTCLYLDNATLEDGSITVLENGWNQLLETSSNASLQHICFRWCHIDPLFMEMIAMSVARHPNAIRKLSFCRTPLVECTNGISTLLQHSNLEVLHLDNCDFDAYACFEVVKSLNGNITLRELRIVGNNSMTLDRALFEYSNLRLEDERPPTASAILALVHVLRDNDTLLSLSLTSSGHAWALEIFEELLRHYNLALRTVELDRSTPETLRSLLRDNERVRVVHSHLQAVPILHRGLFLVAVRLGPSVQQTESVVFAWYGTARPSCANTTCNSVVVGSGSGPNTIIQDRDRPSLAFVLLLLTLAPANILLVYG